MSLLRNRALIVKMGKDPKVAPETEEEMLANVEIVATYAAIAKDVVTHTALVVGGVWCLCKIVERICR